MTGIWAGLVLVLIGAFCFAFGVVNHVGGLVALGFLSLVAAALVGTRGSFPHDATHH